MPKKIALYTAICLPGSSREAGLGWERLRSLAPPREAKQNIFQFLLEEKGLRANIEKREKCFALRPEFKILIGPSPISVKVCG